MTPAEEFEYVKALAKLNRYEFAEAYAKQENAALQKQMEEYEEALRIKSGLGGTAVVMTKSAFNNIVPNLQKQVEELKKELKMFKVGLSILYLLLTIEEYFD